MTRFIVLTFGFLGWGFYEFSGGADFEPQTRSEVEARIVQAAAQEAPAIEIPTRNANISLISVSAEPNTVRETNFRTAPQAATHAVEGLVQASLNVEPEAAPKEEVFLFESLVEGAPTAEDLLGAAQASEADAIAETRAEETHNLWEVAGRRVNMRAGPSTGHGVIVTLTQGTELDILEVGIDGWAQVRVLETGAVGWMAERLLTPAG